MLKKLIIFLFLFTLIVVQSSLADKIGNTSYSASTICNTCTYSITSDTALYNASGWMYGYHTVSAQLDTSLIVQNLFLTIRLDTSYYFASISETLFTAYTTMETSTFEDSNGVWFNVEYFGINAVIEDVDLFVLKTLTETCIAPGDSVLLNFEELTSQAFDNRFVDSAVGEIYIVENLDTASMTVVSPSAELNVYSEVADTVRTTIDESYVGGQVSCNIYFNTNFDFADGFEFTLGIDKELQFDSIVTNSFSYGANDSLVDDTTVLIWKTSGGTAPILYPALLLTAYFTFDASDSAKSESDYKVRIKDDFTFTGCSNYFFTSSNSDSEYVYLSTIKDSAAWKFPNSEVVKGTIDWPYYFKLRNTSPVATDGATGTSNAMFTIDESQFTKVTFDQASPNYSYQSGLLKWGQGGFADTLSVKEYSLDAFSTWIRPSSNFTSVGFMQFDVLSSTGKDTVEHLKFTDTESVYYRNDNLLVLKYSGDTLHNLDGNLDLISGSITVKNSTGGGGGCPMLYTWNGDGYTLENTILTQSQGKSNPEAEDDFYPFALGVVPDDGFYKIQIREYENEITYLDEIELVTVDFHEDLQIAISNQGEIFSYRNAVAPLSAVDEWGRDLMPYVGELDDVWMDVDYPGSMTLTYENLFNTPEYTDGNSKDTRLMATGLPGPPPNKQKVSVESTNGQGNDITAEIEDANGNWYYLGTIPPREIRSENSKFLFDAEGVDLGETFRIKITWKSSYNADFQALYLGKGFDFTETRLSAEDVVHSEIGAVYGKLAASDGPVLTIEPGQIVDVKFKAENTILPDRMRRRFFLKSHGYYKTLTNDLIPDKFRLANNYPNPFNPSTTINFSVPVKSDVSVVVFNMLGQEVKTLYSGQTEAGNHSVVWGGDNSSGKQVASGVYLYRLKTNDFEVTKKMMLLK